MVKSIAGVRVRANKRVKPTIGVRARIRMKPHEGV